MSVKALYYDIDLKKNEIKNVRLHPMTTTERNAMTSSLNSNDAGLIVYDATEKLFYGWDGNQWVSISLNAINSSKLNEAYDGLIEDINVTNTETTRTITLVANDGENISTTFNESYIHEQLIPANQWIVNHNLNRYPKVTIVNDINVEVIADIVYTNTNQVIISFSNPFYGKAYFT
jgi:hypothetical protein